MVQQTIETFCNGLRAYAPEVITHLSERRVDRDERGKTIGYDATKARWIANTRGLPVASVRAKLAKLERQGVVVSFRSGRIGSERFYHLANAEWNRPTLPYYGRRR